MPEGVDWGVGISLDTSGHQPYGRLSCPWAWLWWWLVMASRGAPGFVFFQTCDDLVPFDPAFKAAARNGALNRGPVPWLHHGHSRFCPAEGHNWSWPEPFGPRHRLHAPAGSGCQMAILWAGLAGTSAGSGTQEEVKQLKHSYAWKNPIGG